MGIDLEISELNREYDFKIQTQKNGFGSIVHSFSSHMVSTLEILRTR